MQRQKNDKSCKTPDEKRAFPSRPPFTRDITQRVSGQSRRHRRSLRLLTIKDDDIDNDNIINGIDRFQAKDKTAKDRHLSKSS